MLTLQILGHSIALDTRGHSDTETYITTYHSNLVKVKPLSRVERSSSMLDGCIFFYQLYHGYFTIGQLNVDQVLN